MKNQVPKNSESIFYRERIILLSVGLAIIFWLGEYVAHLLVFDTVDQGAGLFPSDPNELWMRSLVAGLIIGFGLFVRSSVRNLCKAKARLVDHKAKLELQVQARTAELAQANRQLQQELNDRVYLESQLDRHRHHLEELLEERAGELKITNKHLRQEIIEKQQAEDELRESEGRYRGLVEGTDNLVTQVGRDGKFIYVNHTAKSVFGLDPQDCIGLSAFDFIHPDDREGTKQAFDRWLTDKPEIITFENRQVSRSGEVRDILWTCNLIYDETGDIDSINSIAQDITKRKSGEQALRDSEQRFRRLSEAALESIFITDRGTITESNNQAAEMFGYSNDELQGMPVKKLVAPQSRTLVKEHIEGGIEERYKHMALKKDGTVFPVEVHGKTFPYNGRNFRVTAVADLTDQVKADQEIQMANQILEAKQVALREKNLALKHVLEQVDQEKQELKAQIQANVDRVVRPTLRLLRKKVDAGTVGYVDLLDTSLQEIASPLANRLQTSYSSLSPGEIEICNMIRNGLASKEIADFRGVSVQTISMQRKRIRKKLGIAHQSVSLPALLNSLTD